MRPQPELPHIAVVVSGFPRQSETFALRDLLALEAAGMLEAVFATKPGDGQPAQPGVERIAHRLVELPPGEPALQAAEVERRLARSGVAGIHGYFAHVPAEVAELAAKRLGIHFGFSAHARDLRKVPPEVLRERGRRACCLITCNDDAACDLRSLDLEPAQISHGVDTERFSPDPTPPRQARARTGALRALAVGRLVRKKGFDVLIRALAQADSRVELAVVGTGPEHHRLQVLAETLGVTDQIEWLGTKTHAELPDLYRACDVVLVPSVVDPEGDRDGLPNVILEALASGRPVIASDLTGIRPAIKDGENGLLVERGNVDELRAALDRLASQPALAATLGRQARRSAEDNWSAGACAEKFRAWIANAYRPAEIAYVMKGYPRRSEPFIASEIRHLEEEDARIRVFAIKGLSEPDAAPAGGRARAPVCYLPEADTAVDSGFLRWIASNWRSFLRPHASVATKQPLRYTTTLLEALGACLRYRSSWLRPKKVFLKDFLRAGAIADEILRVPTIRHLHGHFCHGSTTMAMYASRLTGLPFSFTAHAKDIYQGKLNPGDLLARKIGRASFVATCTEANRLHLAGLTDDPTRIRTIYHGLDPTIFEPRTGACGAEPTILAVGRFVEKKGFSHLVDACGILKSRGTRFLCRILGEPGDRLEEITRQVKSLGLQDLVRLEGPVPQAELREVYRSSTAFVLPCQVVADGDRDGIPNVLVEAMALEVPVVSTDVSGIPELIDHDVNGLLVPPSNAPALADALERLLADQELRLRLGRSGRRKVLERFDARNTTRVLHELLRSSDGAAPQGALDEAPALGGAP